MRRHWGPVEMMVNFCVLAARSANLDGEVYWGEEEERRVSARLTLAAKISMMYVFGVMRGCWWGWGEVERERRAGTRGWGEKQAIRIAT